MISKYHKSPNTSTWTVCRAKNCPFGDITPEVHATLKPVVMRDDLPVEPRVQIHSVCTKRGDIAIIPGRLEHHVAPEGYTALACGTCGAYLPVGYWEATIASSQERRVPCPNAACDGEGFDPTEYMVDTYPSELKYWNADEVRAAHWFHVTTREHWLEDAAAGVNEEAETEGTVFVHVGSKASAMERLRDLVKDRSGKRVASDKIFYLYEVKLAPETPVNPAVLEDAIDGWPEYIAAKPDDSDFTSPRWEAQVRVLDWKIQEHYQPDGASAYLNVCEAPGTISLIANPTKLVQVARQKIPIPA